MPGPIAALMSRGRVPKQRNISPLPSSPSPFLAHSFLHDALHSPAPTGVKNSNRMPLRIYQDNRQAIGSLNREQQSGSAGYESIPSKVLRRNAIDAVNDVRMNLPRSNQRPERRLLPALLRHRTKLREKSSPIPLNGRTRIIFGKSKVEITFAINAGESARARGKAMHKPRQSAQMRSAKDFRRNFLLDCLARSPSQHASMLQEAVERGGWHISSCQSLLVRLPACAPLRYSFTHVRELHRHRSLDQEASPLRISIADRRDRHPPRRRRRLQVPR